ncbi:hypothetical protein OROGR_027496 [Orobanche gracilis]
MENNKNRGKKPLDLTLKLRPPSPENQTSEQNHDVVDSNDRPDPYSMGAMEALIAEGFAELVAARALRYGGEGRKVDKLCVMLVA